MTMTLVSTVTVGSGGASSIEWTSIPQSGKDLLILLSARAASSAIRNSVGVSFNGVTTNRTYRSLYGNGTSAFASNGGQISTFAGATAANATASVFSSVSIYISNYSDIVLKTLSLEAVTEDINNEGWQEVLAGSWQGGAINQVTLTPSLSTFVQYSTASLYIIS
jgi:hypothetical protein